ncbi:ATP-binding cassette domain-containing protein [Enterococcus lactis]|uniref:ATP-binding cassette domain-containing protein n=2 Tax=Enterococcus TaxID=1350 RepID=UPI0039A60AC8
MEKMITVTDLYKSFSGKKVIDGVSFTVDEGSIFALLGTNGAGKTTIVKMLATLLTPDKGQIRIAHFNVAKQGIQVRERISLTGQFTAVDDVLTGRENLVLIGKLRHLKDHKQRIDELLHTFDLHEAADRPVHTYSGGMRRKLDLAMSLLGNPTVLFLDEPTTGLDPQARASLWETIRNLRKAGVTVFLTTQYLEEADQLADQIAILDQGKIALQGSVAEVRKYLPQGTIELTFAEEKTFQAAYRLVGGEKNEALLSLSIPTDNDVQKVTEILTLLQQNKIGVLEFAQKQPTLDDVFFSIINQTKEEEK